MKAIVTLSDGRTETVRDYTGHTIEEITGRLEVFSELSKDYPVLTVAGMEWRMVEVSS